MSTDQRAVWERYVASWKAASTAEKHRLFKSCLAPHCVYTDPLARAQGWDELVTYMTEFQLQIPGAYFVTEYFLAHHGKSIARWKLKNPDAVQIGEGISYGEYDEQSRLVAMTGFFQPGAIAP